LSAVFADGTSLLTNALTWPVSSTTAKWPAAVIQDIVKLDHASLVTNPAEQRCVVRYEDTGEQFKVIRQLARLIMSNKCAISDCWRVRFSKEPIPNSNTGRLVVTRNASAVAEEIQEMLYIQTIR